ncbi:hypothetical protein UP06_00730 [Bradyrhizobium sp. LTSP857]|nr:hypothetical protein UP06_00730 [Bradyrhizobium sp. LTSP857]
MAALFAPPCWGHFVERSDSPGRFDRIVSWSSIDLTAVGAFEDSHIWIAATQSDADQRHATLAHRAEWPRYRNQRRFRTSVDLGHVMLLPIWRGMPYAKLLPLAADPLAATA